MSPPLGLAIAGLGGFARTARGVARAEAAVRVVAVGDPAAADPGNAEAVAELRAAGVAVTASFEEAVGLPGVEAAWLPVPIGLHRAMTEATLAAGRAVLCEKPIAGCLADAEAMAAAAAASGRPAALGFNALYDPDTLALKRALHGPGGIGRLVSISVLASWPKTDAYWMRSAWTGRLRHGGVAVRDGPANNALAHPLMLALFLAGDADLVAATPIAAEARLLRAAAVETHDTVSARFTLGPGCASPGATLSLQLTHAAAEALDPQVLLRGSRGSWLWKLDPAAEGFAPADRVFASRPHPAVRGEILPRFAALCRGAERPDTPYATFAAGVAHATAVELLHATEVEDVPPELIEEVATPAGTLRAVRGLFPALREAAVSGRNLRRK